MGVLKPCAPLFLWHVSRGGRFETQVVSIAEFAMSDVEDWMTISTYHQGLPEEGPPNAPHEIQVLEWKAERMRAKAHQPDHGGRSISFEEWAEFAAEMRSGMLAAGLAPELQVGASLSARASLEPAAESFQGARKTFEVER